MGCLPFCFGLQLSVVQEWELCRRKEDIQYIYFLWCHSYGRLMTWVKWWNVLTCHNSIWNDLKWHKIQYHHEVWIQHLVQLFTNPRMGILPEGRQQLIFISHKWLIQWKFTSVQTLYCIFSTLVMFICILFLWKWDCFKGKQILTIFFSLVVSLCLSPYRLLLSVSSHRSVVSVERQCRSTAWNTPEVRSL